MKIKLKDSNNSFLSNFKNKINSNITEDAFLYDENNNKKVNIINRPGSVLKGSSGLKNTKVSIDKSLSPDISPIGNINPGIFNDRDKFREILQRRSKSRDPSLDLTTGSDEFIIPITGSVDFFRISLSQLSKRVNDRFDALLDLAYKYYDDGYADDSIVNSGSSTSYFNIKETLPSDRLIYKNSAKVLTIENCSLQNVALNGIYKVEGTSCKDLQCFLYIRNIPIPYKKIITSTYKDGSIDRFNFLFEFPHYLIKHYVEYIEGIKKVSFKSSKELDGNIIFTGDNNNLFGDVNIDDMYADSNKTLGNKLSNINIVNQKYRNSYSDIKISLSAPEFNYDDDKPILEWENIPFNIEVKRVNISDFTVELEIKSSEVKYFIKNGKDLNILYRPTNGEEFNYSNSTITWNGSEFSTTVPDGSTLTTKKGITLKYSNNNLLYYSEGISVYQPFNGEEFIYNGSTITWNGSEFSTTVLDGSILQGNSLKLVDLTQEFSTTTNLTINPEYSYDISNSQQYVVTLKVTYGGNPTLTKSIRIGAGVSISYGVGPKQISQSELDSFSTGVVTDQEPGSIFIFDRASNEGDYLHVAASMSEEEREKFNIIYLPKEFAQTILNDIEDDGIIEETNQELLNNYISVYAAESGYSSGFESDQDEEEAWVTLNDNLGNSAILVRMKINE